MLTKLCLLATATLLNIICCALCRCLGLVQWFWGANELQISCKLMFVAGYFWSRYCQEKKKSAKVACIANLFGGCRRSQFCASIASVPDGSAENRPRLQVFQKGSAGNAELNSLRHSCLVRSAHREAWRNYSHTCWTCACQTRTWKWRMLCKCRSAKQGFPFLFFHLN